MSKEKRKSSDVAPGVSEGEKPNIQDYKSEDKNELGKTRIIEESPKEAKEEKRIKD